MNTILNRRFHAALSARGLMAQKPDIIASITHGRTTHSSEMHDIEGIEGIRIINTMPDRGDRMRKKILNMAHEMGWHHLSNVNPARFTIDMNRVNAWMLKSSYLHKRLDAYKYNELPKLVTQFEQIYKSFLNKV